MFEIGGKQIAASWAEIVAPKHSALLIWDMATEGGIEATARTARIPATISSC